MPNMIDYLKWRGDLSFEQSSFGEVDNLIASYLAYVNLDGIAPEPGEDAVTVKEVSDRFFNKYTEKELKADKSFVRLAPYLLKAMAESRRFADALVQNYVNIINEEIEMQFSALELVLGDGTSYIAFRGTDDTIVGWKEDFHLSNGVVPAEVESVEYLNRTGRACERPLRVGGHSKGGNLSVYGAAGCEDSVKEKIIEVYSNDGPGFSVEFLEDEGLKKILPKIQRFVPVCSTIGMLLNHIVEPVVIRSSQKGIVQHDGFSWEVMGTGFIKADNLGKKTQLLNDALRQWICDMDAKQRSAVIEDFFSVVEAAGAKTLTELQGGGLKSARAMLGQLEKLSPQTRTSVERLVKTVFVHWKELI